MTYVSYQVADTQAYENADKRLKQGTTPFANKESFTDDDVQTFISEEKSTLKAIPNSEFRDLTMDDMLNKTPRG